MMLYTFLAPVASRTIALSKLSPLNLVSIFRCPSPPCNPVYLRHVDPSVLMFSLSLHRHPHTYNPFHSHFNSHFRRVDFSNHLKSKCGLLLVKASDLRINLNLDGAPITSNSYTHPSHSQTSRLLTSSLSLGVPVP